MKRKRPTRDEINSRKLFRFYADHPIRGWIPIGHVYPSRELAKGWASFVRAAWRGFNVRLVWCASRITPSAAATESEKQP